MFRWQVDKATTRCPKRRVLGITCQAQPLAVRGLLGGWSTFTYLPPGTKIIHLPPNLPPKTFMAAGCGLPTAMHAVERAAIRLMDRVVVQGSGPVGLLAAVLAAASGALQVWGWRTGGRAVGWGEEVRVGRGGGVIPGDCDRGSGAPPGSGHPVRH